MSPADRINGITRDLIWVYFPEAAILGLLFFALIFAACTGSN